MSDTAPCKYCKDITVCAICGKGYGEPTPGPWGITTAPAGYVHAITNPANAVIRVEGSLANARRIVQCVNACEGLPNDALDGGWTAKGASAYAKRLEDAVKAFLEAAILLPALSGPAAVAVIEASALGRAALSRASGAAMARAQINAIPASPEAVAWAHEFTNPHDGSRQLDLRRNRPTASDLMPGDTVRLMVYWDATHSAAPPQTILLAVAEAAIRERMDAYSRTKAPGWAEVVHEGEQCIAAIRAALSRATPEGAE